MTDDISLLQLLTDEVPLLDVRAAVEFNKGAFPSSFNLPILNDEERHAVGISYKENGPDAAVELGYKLVSGDIKTERVQSWISFISANPEAQLYCFRGGQRSAITADWLVQAGYSINRIDGGYKRLRNLLIQQLDKLPAQLNTMIVGGRTGTGKTPFIQSFPWAVDLEGLACHRGSAFGRRFSPQPNQINFENQLAIKLLQLIDAGYSSLLLEDESRAVGSLSVPQSLFEKMLIAPVVMLEESLSFRVQHIFDEYIEEDLDTLTRLMAASEYTDKFADEETVPLNVLEKKLTGSLGRIARRLGGVTHSKIETAMLAAFEAHRQDDSEQHKVWIKMLLQDYYDPMYDYQLTKKEHRVTFRGSSAEVREYLTNLDKAHHDGP